MFFSLATDILRSIVTRQIAWEMLCKKRDYSKLRKVKFVFSPFLQSCLATF